MTERVFRLTENQPRFISPELLTVHEGELIWRHYSKQVAVEFPSPRTDGLWELTTQGWAGYIPVTPELSLALEPKVPVSNVFGMLEYAYRHDIRFLNGLFGCHSIQDAYERLAVLLARRVLDQGRKGFYREYVGRAERLPYMRGRLDVPRQAHTPWAVTLPCRFEERTADIADNRILAWTLRVILSSGFCGEQGAHMVRRAYQELQMMATPVPCTGAVCVGRTYHRLNETYQPMHALCRFFLDLCGPTQTTGGRTMMPFLVEMPHLFERFVAEWLKKHIPTSYRLRAQENVPIGYAGNLRFEIDLVLYDGAGTPLMVIDTKYKRPDTPSAADICQVVAYATAKRCREAILVYPVPIASPLDVMIGDIRVRSVVFDLDDDLKSAGGAFLANLIASP